MTQMTGVSADQFRHVLGQLPTGVTVITAHGETGPTGMTANSFTSVSLDPPLVLVCPAKSSETWPSIRETGRFCANIMAGHHGPVCRQFAAKNTDRFAGVPWHARQAGPALDEAVGWIECVIDTEHDAGDHTIVVGRVVAIGTAADTVPLVFFRGRYEAFA